MDHVLAHIDAHGIAVQEGPVPPTGALGPITSVYIRNPDGNLIEITTYVGNPRQPVADDRPLEASSRAWH
jgi:hypothetical protein